VSDWLRPFTGGLDGLENKGKEIKGLEGKALEVRIRPTVPTRGLGRRRGLDHLFKGGPGEATDRRERREPIQGREPLVGVELTRSRGPQIPPPSINLSQQCSLARLGVAGADRWKGDRGRTLPNVTINPCRLGRIVTPLMPAVTPMLAVSGDACGDLNFRLNMAGV
jgi:hypothetical protein